MAVAMCRSVILPRLIGGSLHRSRPNATLRAHACSRRHRRVISGSRSWLRSARPCADKAATVAPELTRLVESLTERDGQSPELTRLSARLGYAPASRELASSQETFASEPSRIAMLEALGDIKDQSSVPLLLDLATQPAHAALGSGGCARRSGSVWG